MRTARRVSFPQDEELLHQIVCYLPTRKEWEPEDFADAFFNKADFQLFRQQSRRVGFDCERHGYGDYLEDVYSEKNTEAQHRLNLWAWHGDLHRGVERSANKAHNEIREQVQFNSVMAVLKAQDEMLSSRRCKGVDPEKLRKVSHKATKAARHFARMMGKADYYAVTVPEIEEKSESHTLLTDTSSSLSSTQTDQISVHRMSAGDTLDRMLSPRQKHPEAKPKVKSRFPRFMQHLGSKRDLDGGNLIQNSV